MECSTKKDSYILTIDADAVIRNVQKSLEEIIEELNEYSYSNEILTKTIKIKRLEKKSHLFTYFERKTIIHLLQINSGAFLSVNSEKSTFVLKKIYDELRGITFLRKPHWSELYVKIELQRQGG